MSFLLSFSPIFLSGSSFIQTFYAQYFILVIFCSKFNCIASYLTVTSYICIPQLYMHIMDSYIARLIMS